MATENLDAGGQNDKSNIEQEESGKENELKPDEFCFECKKSLAKSPELINVTGQSCRRWHPECFKCIICGEPLGQSQSCHVYKDQIVCRADYMRLKRDNSIKCKRCNWPIGASDWVRKAANYVYHLACFNCDICFRQLNTGEQFVINSQSAEALGSSNSESNCETVRLMCKLHFTIDNRRIQNLDSFKTEVHPTELANDLDSSQPTPAETNESHDQSSIKPHDKRRQQDYPILDEGSHQVSKAALTQAAIASRHSPTSIGQTADQVQQNNQMAAKHHHQIAQQRLLSHLSMFKGHSSIALSPSAANSLIDESFMSQHQRGQSSSSTTSSATSTSSSSSVATIGCINGPISPSGCTNPGNSFNAAGSSSSNNSGGSQSKSKRVRTTFTEDQLSILQTHFQIDSNPDGQDLERIATITGLSKRVTQVWFQNSRARQKKYMIKRKPSASLVSNLNHEHHLHANQHFNQRQHPQHASLVMINQSIIGSNELNSPSPSLENSHQNIHPNEHNQLVNKSMNLKNFPHELIEVSFSSTTQVEQKQIKGKADDSYDNDPEQKGGISSRDTENYTPREDDDEKSESSPSSIED